MAEINTDLLRLNFSPNFSIAGTEEANININLSTALEITSTVYGTVTDGTNPIGGATVKIFDQNAVPYKHTVTNDDGTYTISEIPDGTYTISAVKDGYILSSPIGMGLTQGETKLINIICAADTTANLGAIAGILTTQNPDDTNSPLGDAKITLTNAAGETVAITYTASDGEFAFYDVADGDYTIYASKEGYISSAPISTTILNGSIANVDVSMTIDSRVYNGTVSGIIRDSQGRTINGCFVGLYKVVTTADGKTREMLIATTKTNSLGRYLFGTVEEGEYIVKAKQNKPAI